MTGVASALPTGNHIYPAGKRGPRFSQSTMATSALARYGFANTVSPLRLSTLAGSTVNPGAASLAGGGIGTAFGERLDQIEDDHTFTAAVAPVTGVFALEPMPADKIPPITRWITIKPTATPADNRWVVVPRAPAATVTRDCISGAVVGRCRSGGREKRGRERWHVTLALENVCAVEIPDEATVPSTCVKAKPAADYYEGAILQLGNRYITLIKPLSSAHEGLHTWTACTHAGHFENNVGLPTLDHHTGAVVRGGGQKQTGAVSMATFAAPAPAPVTTSKPAPVPAPVAASSASSASMASAPAPTTAPASATPSTASTAPKRKRGPKKRKAVEISPVEAEDP